MEKEGKKVTVKLKISLNLAKFFHLDDFLLILVIDFNLAKFSIFCATLSILKRNVAVFCDLDRDLNWSY